MCQQAPSVSIHDPHSAQLEAAAGLEQGSPKPTSAAPSAQLEQAPKPGPAAPSAECPWDVGDCANLSSVPRLLRVGAGARGHLPATLVELDLKRPLLVTDSFMRSSAAFAALTAQLQQEGVSFEVFEKCNGEPTTATVAKGAVALQRAGERSDCIVGFGGGSVMDTSKAIAASSGYLPVVAVPTSAGTGAEVTRYAAVTDSATKDKVLLQGPGLLPTAALVDFELTLSMPARMIADSGLDTLSHSLEAYASRHANPASDAHALAAMSAVTKCLRTAYFAPTDRPAREALMLAGTRAGLAFSNSSLTLVHGMSQPLGAQFGVPHGASNACLLPVVTQFCVTGAIERYAACSRACGFAAEGDTDFAAGQLLVAGLRQLCSDLQVPPLTAYGVTRETYFGAIDSMASQALDSALTQSNAVVPSRNQMQQLYSDAWDGAVESAQMPH